MLGYDINARKIAKLQFSQSKHRKCTIYHSQDPQIHRCSHSLYSIAITPVRPAAKTPAAIITPFFSAPLPVFVGDGALDGDVGAPEVVALAELLGLPLVANDEAAVTCAKRLVAGMPEDEAIATSVFKTLAASL